MAKMSGQGVRTHHQRAAEYGLQQGLLTLVNDPDNISGQDMLSSRCDVRECRVLLPERVRIRECATCPLGESGWSCSGQRCALRVIRERGPYTLHTQTVPLATFHLLRIFHIRNSVRRYFTSRCLTAGWERRTFQLPRSDMSGSSDSAYSESIHSR